jgi:hypothetical protein
MDIHKPKPWHSVREFLKEYVIIVIGVLTALGAQQGVEALQNRAQAAEARELIRGSSSSTSRAFAPASTCAHAWRVGSTRCRRCWTGRPTIRTS